jgi:hypothetical protein
MNVTADVNAGKSVLWPGATPYFGASVAPNRSGFRGRSRPRCVRLADEPPDHPASAFVPSPVLADRSCFHAQLRSNQGQPMPLLKAPEPVITTQSSHCLRIEESLAPMERYAEFLGTANLRPCPCPGSAVHPQTRQFRSRLEPNPEPAPKPAPVEGQSQPRSPDEGAR